MKYLSNQGRLMNRVTKLGISTNFTVVLVALMSVCVSVLDVGVRCRSVEDVSVSDLTNGFNLTGVRGCEGLAVCRSVSVSFLCTSTVDFSLDSSSSSEICNCFKNRGSITKLQTMMLTSISKCFCASRSRGVRTVLKLRNAAAADKSQH